MRRCTVLLIMGFVLAVSPVLADDATEAAETGTAEAPQHPAAGGAKAHKPQPGNQRGGMSAEARMQGLEKRLLDGIELSGAQRQSLGELEKRFVSDVDAHQAKTQSLRDQMKAARDAGETDKIKEFGAELRSSRKDTPRHTTWIDELREILTPDQQKQFDVNREKIQKESRGRAARQRQPKPQPKPAQ